MIISILQPSFIPWIGYFAIIEKSDFVVFLDHVQFDKRSRQQRNTIKTNTGPLYLTVPVSSKNKFHQKINEVEIDNNEKYVEKHLKSIQYNYSKTKYFEKYFPEIRKIYKKEEKNLLNLNMNFILMIAKEILSNKIKFEFSSNLKLVSKKNDLIIDICKFYKAKKYLSTIGSKGYLIEKQFKKENIELVYSNFEHPSYEQINGKFLPNLSAIDLLLNCGENSKSFISHSISNI